MTATLGPVTRSARLLVAIGIGWILWILTKDALGDGRALLVLVVAAGCAWALTAPLARPEPEQAPATPTIRGFGAAAAVALGCGLALVAFRQPEAGIAAAVAGVVLAAVSLVLRWSAGRHAE